MAAWRAVLLVGTVTVVAGGAMASSPSSPAANQPSAAAAKVVKDNLCKRCIPSPSVLPPTDPAVASTTTEPVPAGSASLPPASSSVQSLGIGVPSQQQQPVLCLEKISAEIYRGMGPHPDGSSRIFLWSQDGKVWLAPVTAPGSRRPLRVDGAPLLDLTDHVVAVVGVALHPQFSANCRVFVAYTDWNAAAGGGSATSAVGNGPAPPFQYQLVVAELSARGAFSEGPTRTEVRRIFSMELPQPPHDGGVVLLFGGDGDGHLHLYLVLSNGAQAADPSQNRMATTLGKIVRFDVNQIMPAAGTEQETRPIDIDPRGCSFDSERPYQLYCFGVDQRQQEVVRQISIVDGTYQVVPVINHGPPAPGTPPSIGGARIYRGSAVPWLIGRLFYMFRSAAWMADMAPEGGAAAGLYKGTARIPSISCSGSSPVPWSPDGGGISSTGEVHAHFVGEDNSKDVYLFSEAGVLRIVNPGLCGGGPPSPWWLSWLGWLLGFLLGGPVVYLLLGIFFGDRGEQAVIRFSCFNTVNIGGNAQVSSAPTEDEASQV